MVPCLQVAYSQNREWFRMVSSSYVYADITFLINLVMDFMILWAAGKLAGLRIVFSRIMVASLLGAIYSMGYLFPHLAGWYGLPVKILFSCLLVILAFWPSGWNEFKKGFLYFYGVSFVVAGAVMASSYIFKNNFDLFKFSYAWLLGGLVIAWGLGQWGQKILGGEVAPGIMSFPVCLTFDGARCRGRGFLDTGNQLQDPLTQRPVVVAEYTLLREHMPKDVQEVLDAAGSVDDCLEAMTATSWSHRLRIIPFTSIGRRHGLLLGIRCDEVLVDIGCESVCHKNVVVGVYQEPLSPEGKFQMLLPYDILENE